MNKLDIRGKLDFSEIDLTAPEKVIDNFFDELSNETQGIVLGRIQPYDGHVESYTRRGWASSISLAVAIDSADKVIDIQDELGASGEIDHKFECYIYTPAYEHYKYRVFFLKYGVSNYPTKIVLEQSVAESISIGNSSYVYNCNNRNELEELLIAIFSSKRLISIMQEIIRIYQSKQSDTVYTSDQEEISTEVTDSKEETVIEDDSNNA